MFVLKANKNRLFVIQKEPITSGSVNAYAARFEFDDNWEGLTKRAVFRGSGKTVSVLLDSGGGCIVPWETLTKPGGELYAGVYRTADDTVLPSIWASLGPILEGVPGGDNVDPAPTPDVWEQALNGKGDGLEYDGLNLSLMSGEKPLSTVQITGGGGESIPVPGPAGKDGISPTVSVEPIDDGNEVTITDANGPHSFTVANGKDGERGPAGEAAGFGEVTATVDDTTGEPQVTVTTSGPNTAKNLDFAFSGLKGKRGERGEPGQPGASGEKGDPGDVWVPSVNGAGDLSWTKNREEPPLIVNIKGPKGDSGADGPQGPQGERGEPFSVAKIYSSVDEMNTGYGTDGVKIGQFVVINTGNVEDPDNATLWVKGESQYDFITDLSGAQGMTGPQGVQGIQGVKGDEGERGPAGVSPTVQTEKTDKGTKITITDAEKAHEFEVLNGKDGIQAEVYSENEIRIGTWIDGRPLYRKVMQLTTPNEELATIGYLPENIIPQKLFAYMRSTYNSWYPLPQYIGSSTILSLWVNDDREIRFSNSGPNSGYTNRPMTLIVEYTKLTDRSDAV